MTCNKCKSYSAEGLVYLLHNDTSFTIRNIHFRNRHAYITNDEIASEFVANWYVGQQVSRDTIVC